MLKEKLHHPAHDRGMMLPKINSLKIETNDTLFFCLDLIFLKVALGKLLLCQFG